MGPNKSSYTGFSFRTTYPGDSSTYFAHYTGDGYKVVVEKGNLEAYVDFSMDEVFRKWLVGDWVIVKSGSKE